VAVAAAGSVTAAVVFFVAIGDTQARWWNDT